MRQITRDKMWLFSARRMRRITRPIKRVRSIQMVSVGTTYNNNDANADGAHTDAYFNIRPTGHFYIDITPEGSSNGIVPSDDVTPEGSGSRL